MSEASPQLSEVNFHCHACGARFAAAPGRVDESPEEGHPHPWRYYAPCAACGEEAAQASWERALLKAWTRATGPKTPEGIAATAKNLAGHPTAEEALRTRFNAMKHGMNARVATYFPARPDKYIHCRSCEVDRAWCAQQAACVKQTQLFMLTHAAFESRNPRHLTPLYADMQATVFAVVQQILQTIVADGVKIEAPEYYTDPAGRLVVASFIDENGKRQMIKKIEAHPLFKPLAELLSRNNLNLADMGMTERVIEDEQEALGRLKSEEDNRAVLENFARQSVESIAALTNMAKQAAERRGRDPVLIEHKDEG